MGVDYDHAANVHSIEGARAALVKLFSDGLPASILDLGCGTGTWLRAALDLGVSDIVGVDGVRIPRDELLFQRDKFFCLNLNGAIELHRRFDVAICLEVAEHLEPKYGEMLIHTLAKHSDRILFSAACPGQSGQHHVNCQWPVYWQSIFNDLGFLCSDAVRWQIWEDEKIEPWYRQNMFWATKAPEQAGKEVRIRGVIHPVMHRRILQASATIGCPDTILKIERGCMPIAWYAAVPLRALWSKVGRKLR